MKNNKTATPILLTIVIGLWLVVFYRIYKSFFSDEPAAAVAVEPVYKRKKNSDEKEVFVLKANYQDPFLGRMAVQAPRISTNPGQSPGTPRKVVKPKKEEVKIDWSFIRYIGLIRNQKNQKQVALVFINGSERMVSEGDLVEGVSFIRNMKDSIKVSYQGATTFLRK